MSSEVVRRIGALAGTTLVDSTWAQWSVLISSAVPAERERAWTIIDPEALVLASFAAADRERRLNDIVTAWANEAAYLMSMQRMLTLARQYPESVQRRLSDFASAALAGGDRRWLRLARAKPQGENSTREKRLGDLRLLEGPALTLRLRAGFGVNAKADVLSLLLGLAGSVADLKMIAAATAFTERAIRTAADEMTLAGFIREIEGRPPAFYADAKAWAHLLQTNGLDRQGRVPVFPRWRYWSAIYLFLARVVEWSQSAERGNWSAYVASSRAHDVYESHSRHLKQAQVDLPVAVTGRGADYLRNFEALMQSVQAWTDDSLFRIQ